MGRRGIGRPGQVTSAMHDMSSASSRHAACPVLGNIAWTAETSIYLSHIKFIEFVELVENRSNLFTPGRRDHVFRGRSTSEGEGGRPSVDVPSREFHRQSPEVRFSNDRRDRLRNGGRGGEFARSRGQDRHRGIRCPKSTHKLA